MLVVYPFGVPAFFLYLLLQNRDKFRRPEVRMEIGFLFDGCSPSVWYFELVDMTHNLILTSILGFLSLSLQLPFGMATCVAMLCFILLTAPYFRAGDDFLHLLAQAELFLWSVVDLAVCAFAGASEVGWILDCSRDTARSSLAVTTIDSCMCGALGPARCQCLADGAIDSFDVCQMRTISRNW
jgi:hypothetical protein